LPELDDEAEALILGYWFSRYV